MLAFFNTITFLVNTTSFAVKSELQALQPRIATSFYDAEGAVISGKSPPSSLVRLDDSATVLDARNSDDANTM